MRYLLLVYTALVLSACSSGGGGASAGVAAAAPAPALVLPGGGGGSGPTVVSVTYYALAENLTVTIGGVDHAATVTGFCFSYETNDYCWDDGWQIPVGLTSSHEQSFWGLADDNGTIIMGSGGTDTDPVTTPKLYSSMVGYMLTPLHVANDVYTGGSPTTLSCTVTGTLIDCVDFQIDTANAAL